MPRPCVSRLAAALLLLSACVSLMPAARAQAPTGRTMTLLAPALLGQTAVFSMTYPATATGNLYAFLWSSPPFTGTVSVTVPGFVVHGLARVDPNNSISVASGLLGPSGTTSTSLAIPNAPSFLGYAWDLQSVDLAFASSEFYFADNDLPMYISGNNIPSNMVPIAAGSFQMGSNATTGSPYFSLAEERPVHPVTISRPFWMGKYEVTQAEYQALLGTNPSYFQGAAYPNSANRPVEMVSWFEAVAYCVALTAQEAAANRLPAGYEYRLPTEAEWEYCCRAGSTTEYHYGASLLCGQASLFFSQHTNSLCASTSTEVVGSYAPNAWGLFDMHGNVWEWCHDWWDGSVNYPSTAVVDPYVNSFLYRSYRGGSWNYYSNYCRSTFRYGYLPVLQVNFGGFRVVLAPIIP